MSQSRAAAAGADAGGDDASVPLEPLKGPCVNKSPKLIELETKVDPESELGRNEIKDEKWKQDHDGHSVISRCT
ncbi:hypothetical protein EVAR_14720_1 [Eumeta japonica]|uniref:Uncharacterized protein n=1 Tax=Eumeta variegata TaxID=151549 RepID=A0A4C1TWM5_EUMVA|nr:hypothetical protein EVAR_14720_1 [Eumeta japonica]